MKQDFQKLCTIDRDKKEIGRKKGRTCDENRKESKFKPNRKKPIYLCVKFKKKVE